MVVLYVGRTSAVVVAIRMGTLLQVCHSDLLVHSMIKDPMTFDFTSLTRHAVKLMFIQKVDMLFSPCQEDVEGTRYSVRVRSDSKSRVC